MYRQVELMIGTRDLPEVSESLSGDSTKDLYIVEYSKTGCMFSFNELCMVVTVDIADKTGKIAKLILEAERNGTFIGHPWRIVFAGKTNTLSLSGTMKIVAWNVCGFLMFAFLVRMVWKVHKAYRDRHKNRLTDWQKKQKSKRHQVFA